MFDSGRSIAAIIKSLETKLKKNAPSEIAVATVYYKPKKNTTDRAPDFYVKETEEWLVFPHEMQGCTLEELRANKPLPERTYEKLPNLPML